ncbi:MAG: succinyl-diaminopimelate desuccinylase [Pseudomonadota bacterium]
MTSHLDPVALTKSLVQIKSVTPDAGGALDFIQNVLEQSGFSCSRYRFGSDEKSSEPSPHIDNLYARRGTQSPNLCFAGHLDVVPAGDETKWKHDPWLAKQQDGWLFGRGCVDMKGAIAAWICALNRLNLDHICQDSSLSFLITGDEEGEAKYGTKPLLKAIYEKGERIDACITGEPTSRDQLGDMIKIGRRGSIHFWLESFGRQGHVGYPHLADNAAHKLVKMLHLLEKWNIDQGSTHFEPSTLSITSIDVDNVANNVVPGYAKAHFNIRFNDLQNDSSLNTQIEKKLSKYWVQGQDYKLSSNLSGESFITPPGPLSKDLSVAIKNQTGLTTQFSTNGGTSDSRFIKNYCPVIDFGLVGKTMHQLNEAVPVEELEKLTEIYKDFIKIFLNIA